jgi:hypothetical protein
VVTSGSDSSTAGVDKTTGVEDDSGASAIKDASGTTEEMDAPEGDTGGSVSISVF